MPSWGQADGAHRCRIPPLPGRSSPLPSGAEVVAQGLHLSEAAALTSFPRTPGAQGRGGEDGGGDGQRTRGRVSWSRKRWGQNWELLGLPQLQGLHPTLHRPELVGLFLFWMKKGDGAGAGATLANACLASMKS